jgi:hypothetical protein
VVVVGVKDARVVFFVVADDQTTVVVFEDSIRRYVVIDHCAFPLPKKCGDQLQLVGKCDLA